MKSIIFLVRVRTIVILVTLSLASCKGVKKTGAENSSSVPPTPTTQTSPLEIVGWYAIVSHWGPSGFREVELPMGLSCTQYVEPRDTSNPGVLASGFSIIVRFSAPIHSSAALQLYGNDAGGSLVMSNYAPMGAYRVENNYSLRQDFDDLPSIAKIRVRLNNVKRNSDGVPLSSALTDCPFSVLHGDMTGDGIVSGSIADPVSDYSYYKNALAIPHGPVPFDIITSNPLFVRGDVTIDGTIYSDDSDITSINHGTTVSGIQNP